MTRAFVLEVVVALLVLAAAAALGLLHSVGPARDSLPQELGRIPSARQCSSWLHLTAPKPGALIEGTVVDVSGVISAAVRRPVLWLDGMPVVRDSGPFSSRRAYPRPGPKTLRFTLTGETTDGKLVSEGADIDVTLLADSSEEERVAGFEDELRSPHAKRRLDALSRLRSLGRFACVGQVTGLFEADPNPEVRMAALALLMDLRAVDAVPAAIRVLPDPDLGMGALGFLTYLSQLARGHDAPLARERRESWEQFQARWRTWFRASRRVLRDRLSQPPEAVR